jgi:glycosyltransferase involved in cell wall biosynthesis
MKKRTPLVSCIIPTYNREKFLPISIGSVLKQTYKNWELIIVDDRSTDGTKKLIEKYMKKDKRIKYVKNIHKQGPSGARNQGIELAKGKYIAFLDSDDEWMSFHLEEMIYYLEKYPDRIDLINASRRKINFKTKKIIKNEMINISEYPKYKLENAYILKGDLFNISFKKRVITNCTMVAKKEIIEKIRFEESLYMNEDSFFIKEILYNKFRVGFLPKYNLNYYIHNNHISNCNNKAKHSKIILLGKRQEKYFLMCLDKFKLNKQQQQIIYRNLADLYFWNIGYNGYLQLKDYKNAKKYFIKGLRLNPFNFNFWKTYIKRIILRK